MPPVAHVILVAPVLLACEMDCHMTMTISPSANLHSVVRRSRTLRHTPDRRVAVASDDTDHVAGRRTAAHVVDDGKITPDPGPRNSSFQGDSRGRQLVRLAPSNGGDNVPREALISKGGNSSGPRRWQWSPRRWLVTVFQGDGSGRQLVRLGNSKSRPSVHAAMAIENKGPDKSEEEEEEGSSVAENLAYALLGVFFLVAGLAAFMIYTAERTRDARGAGMAFGNIFAYRENATEHARFGGDPIGSPRPNTRISTE